MLKESRTFTSFSVNDIQKAKKFYGQTLGLEVSESNSVLKLAAGRRQCSAHIPQA